jgi:hypothetical protein
MLASIGEEAEMDFGEEEEKNDGMTEIEFECDYNENRAPDQESIPALLLINGARKDGGFRVVPGEDRNNREAEMLCILWKDSGNVDCSTDLKVWFGNECSGVVKFKTLEDYDKFKNMH